MSQPTEEQRQKATVIGAGGGVALLAAVVVLLTQHSLGDLLTVLVLTFLGIFMLVVARGLWRGEGAAYEDLQTPS